MHSLNLQSLGLGVYITDIRHPSEVTGRMKWDAPGREWGGLPPWLGLLIKLEKSTVVKRWQLQFQRIMVTCTGTRWWSQDLKSGLRLPSTKQHPDWHYRLCVSCFSGICQNRSFAWPVHGAQMCLLRRGPQPCARSSEFPLLCGMQSSSRPDLRTGRNR